MGIFLSLLLIIFLFATLLFRVLPRILAYLIKRKMGGSGAPQGRQKKEGEVYVSKDAKPQEKVIDKNVGEYVDFEPVKEDTKGEL